MAISEIDRMRLGLAPEDEVLSSTPRFGMDVQMFPSLSGLPSADSLKEDALAGLGLSPSTSSAPPINVTADAGSTNAAQSLGGAEPQKGRSLAQRIALAIEGFGAGIQGRDPLAMKLNVLEAEQEERDLQRMIQVQGLIQKDIDRLGDLPIAQREAFIAQRSDFYSDLGVEFETFASQPELTASSLMEIPEIAQIAAMSGTNGVRDFIKTKDGQELIALYNSQKLIPGVQTKLEALTDFIRENEPATLENGLRYAEIAARNNELPESIRFTQAELGVLNRNQTQFSELIEPDEVAIAKAKKGQASSGTIITLFSPDGKRRRGFRAGDPRVDSLLDAGWTREPITEASASSLFSGPPTKAEVERLHSLEIQAKNVISEIGYVRDLIKDNPAAVSKSGAFASFANNIRATADGMAQILGTEFYVGNTKTTADDVLSAASNLAGDVFTNDSLKRMGAAAGDYASLRSSLVFLAYSQAIIREPGGRVSDSDIKLSMDELGKQLTGDPKILDRVLSDVERRTIQMFENAYGTIARNVPEAPQMPNLRRSPAGPAAIEQPSAQSGGVPMYRKGAGPGVYKNEAGETIIVTPDNRILKDVP